MSGRIKAGDAKLMSRSARAALKSRTQPYYRQIERGLYLGYRKPVNGSGVWLQRKFDGHRYSVLGLKTPDGLAVLADDDSDLPANGTNVLTFTQAQDAVRSGFFQRPLPPLTIDDALQFYFRSKMSEGRDMRDAQTKARNNIMPILGALVCEALTPFILRDWLNKLGSSPPRRRNNKGGVAAFRPFEPSAESLRRRRASANRVLALLKAALNCCFEGGKISSDTAWRKVKPFKGVDSARLRYLTVDEANRLIAACDHDFKLLVQGAVLTGARFGQLAASRIQDFNADAATVRFETHKGRGRLKHYHCRLSDEGVEFFRDVCTGRDQDQLIFRNFGRVERAKRLADHWIAARLAKGKNSQQIKNDFSGDDLVWRTSEQVRPMTDACVRAGLKPIGFHGLRHTWASLSLMNGVPLIVVASNLGHSDTRMVEKHYGHLASSFISEAIRLGAPRFSFNPESHLKQRQYQHDQN